MSDMKTSLKRMIAAAGAVVMMTSIAGSVSAMESYDPYSYDRWGDAVSSQVGYSAERFVDGKLIDGLAAKIEAMEGYDYDKEEWKQLLQLKEPQDIFIDHNQLMYIVDKGNNRVIVTDLEFNMVNYLDKFTYNGETLTLSSPQGVFVDPETDMVYIADTENSRVIKCDYEGNVDRLFEKPASEIYTQELTFKPEKVVVDKAGNVYIVVGSVTKGAVMYDANGEFLGFFGANRVEATAEIVVNAFWNTIATEAQREHMTKSTAIGFDNFDIDDEGFIFTVTESQDVETDTVKKVNPEGTNILHTIIDEDTVFGDHNPAYWSIYSKRSSIVDIDIGENGYINLLDFVHGRVFQYDEKTNLMFVFGGTGNQLGTFLSAVALESYDNRMYVLDSRKNGITIFKRTQFGEIVTEATNKYNDGLYDESEQPWRDVIKYDGNYRRAYIGIGNALLNRNEYKEAMKYFKVAISRKRYNRAFEGYRDQLLQKYLTPCVVIIIVLAVVIKVLQILEKKAIITFPWTRRRGG